MLQNVAKLLHTDHLQCLKQHCSRQQDGLYFWGPLWYTVCCWSKGEWDFFIVTLWVVILFKLVGTYQLFRGTCHFHPQSKSESCRNVGQLYS